MLIVKCENIKKYYGKASSTVKALDGISLEIYKGDFLIIEGASGSGKSTLLHIMAGLDIPSEGNVMVEGHDLIKMGREDITIFRRQRIGFIFQSFNLVPMLSVYDNIVLPSFLDGKKPDTEYINEIISKLGLGQMINRMPHQLSGGQQQRVAIARALILKPAVILGDEPTGNLDSQTGNEVMCLLKELARLYNQTLVVITHNQQIAEMGERKIKIKDGKLVD